MKGLHFLAFDVIILIALFYLQLKFNLAAA